MTARQPRRTRRRTIPAASLPRPTAAGAEAHGTESAAVRAAATRRHREHHVTKDYRYIHRDLLAVAGIGVIVIAFIIGMSFVV